MLTYCCTEPRGARTSGPRACCTRHVKQRNTAQHSATQLHSPPRSDCSISSCSAWAASASPWASCHPGARPAPRAATARPRRPRRPLPAPLAHPQAPAEAGMRDSRQRHAAKHGIMCWQVSCMVTRLAAFGDNLRSSAHRRHALGARRVGAAVQRVIDLINPPEAEVMLSKHALQAPSHATATQRNAPSAALELRERAHFDAVAAAGVDRVVDAHLAHHVWQGRQRAAVRASCGAAPGARLRR